MAKVDGVNDTNTALYTAGGAAVGAAAGGALGYYSKPHWDAKTEYVTDKFVKSLEKAVNSNEQAKAAFTSALAAQFESKPAENAFYNFLKNLTEEDFAAAKLETTKGKALNLFKAIADNTENDVKEFEGFLKEGFTKANVEEIVNNIQNDAKSCVLSKYFATDGKAIAETTQDGLGAVAKKAANSMKLKTAALYGAIGAAVVGFLVWAFASKPKDNALETLKKEVTAADK